MKAGPKAAVEPSSLPFRPRSAGSARFAVFCQRFIRVPKGTGALSPLRLRPWQIELVGSVLDADPKPRTAGWMMPRGQGKSTLVAALGLYDLLLGDEGAVVVVAATDERQAGIVFRIGRADGGAAPRARAPGAAVQGLSCGCRVGARRFSACRPSRNALRAWTIRWRSSMRSA